MSDKNNFQTIQNSIPLSEKGNSGRAVFPQQNSVQNNQRKSWLSCASWISCIIVLIMVACITLAVYSLVPGNITLLILGIDRAPDKSFVGRSDTIIMTTFDPMKPYIGMLSVPRDLWVTIPGVGENRINTAHFFAEANQPGAGPAAAIDTIENNMGVKMQYYVRIRFDGLVDIVDAMDGVDINLSEPMAGYEPGQYHLNGTKALAFARNRTGSDDFFRMKQGQFLIKSMLKQLITPGKLTKLPRVISAIYSSVDTNLPLWQMPRILMTFLVVGYDDIDNRVIDRELVTPYTTDQGASVLLPDWSLIKPLVDKMFEQ
jgi:polyisoprenyl-teichoic acid--peptidoglycan teichoic acid transferase